MKKPDSEARLALRERRRHREDGLALIATLLVLAVMGLLVAGAVRAALTSVRTSGLDYHEARAFYAAEAGGEAALSQLTLALRDGFVSDAELAAIRPPRLEGFSYDSFAVEKRGEATAETITDGPYAGLYALTQNVEVYSLAEDRNGTVSGVILRAKAQAIPIFQFGVFYEQDLEATNGPPLEFTGRVHSNGNIYLSSTNAWFREPITTPNKVFRDRKDYHEVLSGVLINDASGEEAVLDFDSRTLPGPEAFKAASCEHFSCRLQTDAFGVDSLQLPLPDGVPARELVRPREESDGAAEREAKFAWNADAYVTVDLTTIRDRETVCAGADEEDEDAGWPTITVQRDGGPAPGPGEMCDIFMWRWSAFYDGRENALKDVLDIDMQQLRNWTGGDTSRAMELIYVDFLMPEGIDEYGEDVRGRVIDAEVNPAVRVTNGATLPNRLTVATEWPLYVQGDYNAVPGRKRPAALVGDGITILSGAWRDGQNRPPPGIFNACEDRVQEGRRCPAYRGWSNGWSDRPAVGTTVNAAVLAGHWATPCDHEAPACSGGYWGFYGGGIENFPRFLEHWGAAPFRYRGALVSLFTSQKTSGAWSLDYYDPPARDWSFDMDFRNPELLPPGTPTVGNVVRTALREAF